MYMPLLLKINIGEVSNQRHCKILVLSLEVIDIPELAQRNIASLLEARRQWTCDAFYQQYWRSADVYFWRRALPCKTH